MKPRAAWIFRNPARYFVFFFVLVNLLLRQPGNPNPASRLATLAAMSETHSFRIDSYTEGPLAWTNDWARTPEGAYYSNKAPGPMLLAFPIFWIMDRGMTHGIDSPAERNLKRRSELPFYNQILSLLFQVLPFGLLVLWAIDRLQKEGISNEALQYAAIAMLFGNTASSLMNTYFGHGVTAVFLLAMLLSLERKSYGWVGFFFGNALLSEYSTAALLPALLGVIGFYKKGEIKSWIRFTKGGIVPALLWSFYHIACFGSPWVSADKYVNPEFLAASPAVPLLYGILQPIPASSVLLHLLFGTSRGLLFTQPWVLCVFFYLVIYGRHKLPESWRPAALFSGVGLGCLLWMNACFNGWHGGRTIGPRYLSALMPLFGLLSAFVIERSARPLRNLLWILLAVSVGLCGLIFATTLYVPALIPLWPFLLKYFLRISLSRAVVRLSFFATGFLTALWITMEKKPLRFQPDS